MNQSLRLAIIVLFVFALLFLGIQWLSPRSKPAANSPAILESQTPDQVLTLDWQLLGTYDLAGKRRGPELAKVDQKDARIAGFMVPLEDFQFQVREFLLVPNPMMCIHVPPPPPNQMVYVKMPKDRPAKIAHVPIWVRGRFEVVKTESPYGDTAFVIEDAEVTPYSRHQ